MPDDRLPAGIIGFGRVGGAFAGALIQAGHPIVAVTARSPASRERAGLILPKLDPVSPSRLAKQADLVFLTVPDDQIKDLAESLAKVWRPGQIVVHAAGVYGWEVLEPVSRAGGIALAVHPVMTFTGTSLDVARLRGTPCAIDAAPGMAPLAAALALELGGQPFVVSSEHRPAYHAALAHAANHLVTLICQAAEVLRASGVDSPAEVLGPLTRAALENALSSGAGALTGPAARGDDATLAAHLASLVSYAATRGALVDGSIAVDDAARQALALVSSYQQLASATLEMAAGDGRITADQVRSGLRVLRPEPDGAVPRSARPVPSALPEPGAEDPRPARPVPLAAPDAGRAGQHQVVRTWPELTGALAPGERTVVMTMGALHQGHLDLVEAARQAGGQVIVTIFVNPLQFGQDEDFERYPRDLEHDLMVLSQAGADLVYAPQVLDIYPDGEPVVTVDPGSFASRFEGAIRPGHFTGVLTVVHKLLSRTGASAAVFGEKDAQQLAAVQRMNLDLDLGVRIIPVATRRESDGLAMSSRNAYLSVDQRRAALVLPRAIEAGAAAAAGGASAHQVRQLARRELGRGDNPELPEYMDLVDPMSFQPVPGDWVGVARLIGAFNAGPARLIDNQLVRIGGHGAST
ncbi:MAG: pantoate--beta-alanine ligase [Bifidobacteriaceae bacterium]|jgi:pantoate--beta-alanine ligase|nr:pantoate--beta-alanine ligase [Bifidobacteriaceae bacterium]